MNERMKSPAVVLDVTAAIQTLQAPIYQSGLPVDLLGYVGLRVGQITNCEFAIHQAFVRAEGNATAQERLKIEFYQNMKYKLVGRSIKPVAVNSEYLVVVATHLKSTQISITKILSAGRQDGSCLRFNLGHCAMSLALPG